MTLTRNNRWRTLAINVCMSTPWRHLCETFQNFQQPASRPHRFLRWLPSCSTYRNIQCSKTRWRVSYNDAHVEHSNVKQQIFVRLSGWWATAVVCVSTQRRPRHQWWRPADSGTSHDVKSRVIVTSTPRQQQLYPGSLHAGVTVGPPDSDSRTLESFYIARRCRPIQYSWPLSHTPAALSHIGAASAYSQLMSGTMISVCWSNKRQQSVPSPLVCVCLRPSVCRPCSNDIRYSATWA